MDGILQTLSALNYGNVFIWIMRFGVILAVLGFFMIPKKKRPKLRQAIAVRKDGEGSAESDNPLVRHAEGMMERGLLKGFRLKEGTKEYNKAADEIAAAGGLHNATPQTVEYFRIIAPLAVALVLFSAYFLNLGAEQQKAVKDLSAAEAAAQTADANSLSEGIGIIKSFAGKSDDTVTLRTAGVPHADPMVLMWLFIGSACGYLIPDMYLKSLSKKRVATLRKEIPTFRTFTVSMLETKVNTVYSILGILAGSTTALKEPIMKCMNEYYVNPSKAIAALSATVDDEEFRIVCKGLLQAVSDDKDTTLIFLRQSLDQYDTMKHLKAQEKIKKKPNLFVAVLAIPLCSILIIWFYPWFLDAMSVLGGL